MICFQSGQTHDKTLNQFRNHNLLYLQPSPQPSLPSTTITSHSAPSATITSQFSPSATFSHQCTSTNPLTGKSGTPTRVTRSQHTLREREITVHAETYADLLKMEIEKVVLEKEMLEQRVIRENAYSKARNDKKTNRSVFTSS